MKKNPEYKVREFDQNMREYDVASESAEIKGVAEEKTGTRVNINFVEVWFSLVKRTGRRVDLGPKMRIQTPHHEGNMETLERRIRRDYDIKPEKEIKILEVKIIKNLGTTVI